MAKKSKENEIIKEESNFDLINEIANDLKKAMGNTDLAVLSDDGYFVDDFISSGNFAINYAISGRPITGGFPVGRVTEIFGMEASGKTLLSTMALIETQRRNGVGILIDTEYAFWTDFFSRQGGNPNFLLRSHPETLESVWTQIEGAAKVIREKDIFKDKYITIVWDSVSATPTLKELNGDISDSEMAERARINSKGLRKLTGQIARQRVTLICINQVRNKIGLVFGDPTTTTGGNAFKFHASLRIQTKIKAKITNQQKKVIGVQGEMKVIKNKIYVPDGQVEYDILYDKGINPLSGFISLGKSEGFIEQSGAWYTIVGTKIKFNKSNLSKVFCELAENNFNGVEFILGFDKSKINTDEFKDSLKHMIDKINMFNNDYNIEEVKEENNEE